MTPQLRNTVLKFLRFFVVGITAFVVDAGLLYLLADVLGFRLDIADIIAVPNAISVICGYVTSFILNRIWAFKSTRENVPGQLWRFILVVVIIYIGNQLLFGFLHLRLELALLPAKVLVTGLQMLVSFFAYSKFVFRSKS